MSESAIMFCCPWCRIATVPVELGEAEAWAGPDGQARRLVAGQCVRCASLVLSQPSQAAIDELRDRLNAMHAHGPGPAVQPDDAYLSDG